MLTLINPPGLKTFSGLNMHTPNPPLGLAYIAGTLRQSEIEFSVIDAVGEGLDTVRPYEARKDLMIQGLLPFQIIDRIHPRSTIIALTCTFSTFWPLTREFVFEIKKRFPDVTMVLGGEHGSAVPKSVLESSEVDVVVLGEGEDTFIELVHAIWNSSSLSTVSGIAYLDKGLFRETGLSPRTRNIDQLPLPAWDLFPIREYISRHQINGMNIGRSMPLLATRGCPYQCTFCSSPQMWTTRYIPRNPVLVVDEIQLYKEKYSVTNFDFQDLTAIVKRSWAIKFCQELIDRDLNITWQMPSGTRSEVMDEEVLDLLYKAGCRALAFAPESGSTEILDLVKKRVNLVNMRKAVKNAVKRGLKVSCFFVIGFPQDNKQSLKQTFKVLIELAVLGAHDVSVSKFVPYPGSELFLSLQKQGKIELDDKFFVSPIDFYNRDAECYAEALTARRLYWSMILMYTAFYITSFVSHPWRTTLTLYHAIFFRVEEARYAKWLVDRLFVRPIWRKSLVNDPSLTTKNPT